MKKFKNLYKVLWLYILTLSRIILAFLAFLFLIKFDNIFLTLIFIILVEITDLLDGYLARKLNLVTFVGKILDPFSDSISRLIIYGSLAYKGLCLPFVPIIMVLRDIVIAYTRIVQITYSIDCSVRFSGKLKAFIQGFGAIILVSLPFFKNISLNLKHDIIYFISYFIVAIVLYSLFDYTLGTAIKYKNLSIDKKK
jgi:cardiolipin synthase